MADIKTRDAVKGTIKTIDKSAVAAERMKDAFIRTKEKADHSYYSAENSPEEYAADRVTRGVDATVHRGVMLAKPAASNGKKIASKAKSLEEHEAAQPREQAKNAAKKGIETAREAAHSGSLPIEESANPTPDPSLPVMPSTTTPQPEQAGVRIKTREHRPSTIRTRNREQKSIRLFPYSQHAGIGLPGGGARRIKTIEQRPHPSSISAGQKIQTSRATAHMAQRTVQANLKAAKGTVQATKHSAETAASAVRAAITETKTLISALTAGSGIAVFVILLVVLLGVAVALFGRRSSTSSYMTVSPEVEAYTPIITIYARQHGIPEYVELIKAVMMQESGGQGSDPMQCSESGYNTRYPHYPNAITDPEYSINVGVQTLADVLRMAGTESPIDLDRVSLALQGYNYGPGYISWAMANYGGYSEMNAIEFSNMMASQYHTVLSMVSWIC